MLKLEFLEFSGLVYVCFVCCISFLGGLERESDAGVRIKNSHVGFLSSGGQGELSGSFVAGFRGLGFVKESVLGVAVSVPMLRCTGAHEWLQLRPPVHVS